MLLQAVTGAHLEALKYFSIGSLDLSITFWMSNGHIADLDAKILVVSLECTAGELGTIVNDPKPADDGLDELDYGLLVDLDHRGCFWPIGELVDGDVQIPKSFDGPGVRTQDVHPPLGKRP
jgi:hypothetical protein